MKVYVCKCLLNFKGLSGFQFSYFALCQVVVKDLKNNQQKLILLEHEKQTT